MAGQDKYLLSIRNRFKVNGKALTEARIAKNLSLQDIATSMDGCNKSSVSRWEQGTLVPSEERIFKLVELLGTTAFIEPNLNYGKDTRAKWKRGSANSQGEKKEQEVKA